VLEKIDKKQIIKDVLIYAFILIISFSLARVGFRNNYFIFSVPWILFCFLNNKFYGYFSCIVSFFCLGHINSFFYLSFLLVFVGVLFFRYLFRGSKRKLVYTVSFYCFILVFIEGVFTQLIYDSNEYILMFLLGVISYWIMRYFCDIFFALHSNEKRFLVTRLGTFILFIIGVCFLSLGIEIFEINISLVLLVILGFIASKISLETGVLYSFLIGIMLGIYNGFDLSLVLFFYACIINFLLNGTSKITLVFTYSLGVFLFLYYLNLDYFSGVNYCLGAVLYCFIPSRVINKFSEFCFGSEKYIEKIICDNESKNLEISNKIIKMEEIFSLVCSKVGVKGRIRKNEKELLLEEVNVFDNLLKEFACDIVGNNYYGNVEKKLYKCGFDLLYFEVSEGVFKDKIIKINIRCERVEIDKVVVPLVSRAMRCNLKIMKVIENEVFGYYEVTLKSVKHVNISFGVSQRAKDKEVCGDSYLVYESKEKQVFALCDGMGIGKEAKERSKLALDLLKKFMDVGFEEEQAINSINCILKNECNKESYTTLDLFIYDKFINECYFIKNGACNSYIISNGEISTISGNSLPIGIMDKVEFKKIKTEINSGDYVVIVSDGVSERKLSLLNKIKGKEPQKITSEIINAFKDSEDDETIMVIKIKK